MTDTVPIGLVVVRLTQPVRNYPVGTELGYKDVADAIAALGSAHYFEVVRDQQGNPIPPLTPEEIEEAERAAQRRAKARRLILGADFDPLWERVDGIPSAEELEQMRDDVEAVETALVGKADADHRHDSVYLYATSRSNPTSVPLMVAQVTVSGRTQLVASIPAAGRQGQYGESNAVARADHLHTEDDIAGLSTRLSAIEARLDALEGEGA